MYVPEWGELKPRTPEAWVATLCHLPVLLRGIDVFLLRSHPEEVRFGSLDLTAVFVADSMFTSTGPRRRAPLR